LARDASGPSVIKRIGRVVRFAFNRLGATV